MYLKNFRKSTRAMSCRWAYLKDRTDRSALWAAITTLVVGFFSIFWTMILKKRLQLKADAETARIKALEAEEVSDSLELRIPSVVASAEIGVQGVAASCILQVAKLHISVFTKHFYCV